MAGRPGDWMRAYRVEHPIYERKGHRLQGDDLGVFFRCECGLATTSLTPQAFGPCVLSGGSSSDGPR